PQYRSHREGRTLRQGQPDRHPARWDAPAGQPRRLRAAFSVAVAQLIVELSTPTQLSLGSEIPNLSSSWLAGLGAWLDRCKLVLHSGTQWPTYPGTTTISSSATRTEMIA